MKKSFTLLEVIISITIFMILLVFLYKVLDQTRLSNNQFQERSEKLINNNNFYNILLEDVAESYSKINILNSEGNSIVKFESNNTYHNSFYNHITYLLSSSNYLVRIESKDIFNQANTSIAFYDNAYIDILVKDVEYFEMKKNRKTTNIYYAIALKQKDKKKVLFNTYRFHPEIKKTNSAIEKNNESEKKEEVKK